MADLVTSSFTVCAYMFGLVADTISRNVKKVAQKVKLSHSSVDISQFSFVRNERLTSPETSACRPKSTKLSTSKVTK